jgi:hypothetical protein
MATSDDDNKSLQPIEDESLQPIEDESFQPIDNESLQPIDDESSQVDPGSAVVTDISDTEYLFDDEGPEAYVTPISNSENDFMDAVFFSDTESGVVSDQSPGF